MIISIKLQKYGAAKKDKENLKMNGFKLRPMGTVEFKGAKAEMYKLNGVNICVSVSNDFVCEENAENNGKKVLTISFSYNNRQIPQMLIDYALNFFGIDTDEHYYFNIRSSYDYKDDCMIDIHYYEQLQDA